MNALWIRVEANEKSSRRVWKLRRALGGLPVPLVVGYLTCLGGEIAQHAPDGDISDVDDELLEEWAMWDGEPGLFSAEFRAACAPDGEFIGWGETMGELVRRREKDRNRKRGTSTETPTADKTTASDVPRNSTDVPRNSGVRDVTRRDETDVTTATSSSPACAQAREELVAVLPPDYHADLGELLERIPLEGQAAWLRSLLGFTTGLNPLGGGLPNAVTGAQVGEALRQFAANGESNRGRFAGYLRRVVKPPDPSPGGGGGGSPPGRRGRPEVPQQYQYAPTAPDEEPKWDR